MQPGTFLALEEVGVLTAGHNHYPGQTREGDYRDLIYPTTYISPQKEVGRSTGAFTHHERVCGRFVSSQKLGRRCEQVCPSGIGFCGLVVDLLAEWLTEVRCELPAVIQSARDPPFGPCEIAFPSRHIEIDGDARHPASAQLRSRHIHKLERPLAAVSLHFLQAICTLHN